MSEKEDYLTSYRVFFEKFAATVNPEDQLPVQIAGYTITEAELVGEVLYWTTQYLSEKQCPLTLMTPLRRIILDEVRIASKKTPNEYGYKSDEAVYIALRLMQAVTARVNDICLRYLDNARLDTLPPPPPLAQRDLKTVSCATKNSRRVMEDRHVEIGNLEALFGIETTEPTSFYAVYDGHAGSAAATYCAAHLHQYLVESPHFTTDLRRAMRDAYLKTDADFIRKSNQERACGGSTAVTVAVRGRRLLAAWAGDSLALLAKRMRLMQLVRPHKPGRQDERERIESAGGAVLYWGTWRVNGQLAVSRAIGDAQYKPYVTARPEIATVELDGDEDFVVVACDGLWDFVSEDDVALSVYRQIAADPDDLKAVTKRLILQAKRQGSADNISIIVVFLKDPRDIAADNCPPMDLGLDNAMMNVPPFAIDTDVCKRQVDAAAALAEAEVGECAEAEADAEVGGNGVDNSDSDSEDLGPETAVDADDIDSEARHQEPQAPTPPAHILEEGHVDGALVDNVAESGEDSEDEWNYYKGEGEREEQNPSEEPDEPPRSETPCQDNSAWESSSVDMNSSPLNPDAPVFIPGGVAGTDVLLAESPRKPLPMDDIELPDVAQFQTEAVVRPAELLDLDNCDQLNGHHNLSLEETITEHMNGNDKCNMDSLGFGFNVDIEPDKVKDTGLIQDFDRIQKDTTDFCNIQVFQTHTETNPFAVEDNDAIFERLKNKERDPMSMSFYQEKDDDTCDRLSKNELHVDLNAVQLLPDSDDEDIQTNGICENDKENIPEQHQNIFDLERHTEEPNNDVIRFDDRPADLPQNIENFGQADNFVDYNATNAVNNIENYSNIEFESTIPEEAVLQTDTPESHKLLFEQIPEIPDGKSSELGFTNDELHDPSESEKEVQPVTPQDEISEDIDMENKLDDLHPVEAVPQLNDQDIISEQLSETNEVVSPVPGNDIPQDDNSAYLAVCPARKDDAEHLEELTTETVLDENAVKENGQNIDSHTENYADNLPPELHENVESHVSDVEQEPEAPIIKLDSEHLTEVSNLNDDNILAESPFQTKSPLPADVLQHNESPLPTESPLPSTSPLPTESHLPVDDFLSRDSPLPAELSLPSESPLPDETLLQTEITRESVSPRPKESPLPNEPVITVDSHHEVSSPLEVEGLVDTSLNEGSPSPMPNECLLPSKSPIQTDLLSPSHSPIPQESELQNHLSTPSPIPSESPINFESTNQCESLLQSDIPVQSESPMPVANEQLEKDERNQLETLSEPVPSEPVPSPLPADVPLPGESPLPTDEATLEADEVTVETVAIVETDKPLESEEQVEADLPVQLDTLLDVDTSVEAVVDVHIPSEPEIVLEPKSVHEDEVAVKSDLISEAAVEPEVQRDIYLAEDHEARLEIEAAVEAEAPVEVEAAVEAESQVEIETGVEAEAAEESEATLDSEIPVDAEVAVEAEATVETEIAVEAEPAVETEAAVEVEATADSEEKQYSAVQPDVLEEPVATVQHVLPHDVTHTDNIQRRDTTTPECISPTHSTHDQHRLTPDIPHERHAVTAPAPDLLPEEPGPQTRHELITDVDIGIPESRAQEICVPVTNEIQLEEAVQPPTASPPTTTLAVEPTAAKLDAASLSDTPIAADSTTQGAAVAVIAAGAAAGLAAAVVKAKSTTTTKKSPTTPTAKPDARTPKSAPKSTTSSRTPTAAAATKRPATSGPAARTPTAAKTPSSATKMPVTTARTMPATRTPTTASKPATPITKSATPATKTTPTAKPATQARVPTATRAPPSKPNGVAAKPAPASARSTSAAPRAAPASRTAPKTNVPAPRPAAAKTESAAKLSARPAPRPAHIASKPLPKPADRKPLTNGDAKELKPAARPAPRPAAPAARPAPRPTPRAAPTAPAPANKTSAPKPLPRATPLDKQSKDLANKRITAKTAPPRTAPPKSTAALGVKKAVPKKPLDTVKKEAAMNGLSNGDVISKPPPSPPVADNALLPDVIA